MYFSGMHVDLSRLLVPCSSCVSIGAEEMVTCLVRGQIACGRLCSTHQDTGHGQGTCTSDLKHEAFAQAGGGSLVFET